MEGECATTAPLWPLSGNLTLNCCIEVMWICFISQKHQLEGRKQGLEDEIRKFKKELRDDMFKDAEQKHRDKMIALRVGYVIQ